MVDTATPFPALDELAARFGLSAHQVSLLRAYGGSLAHDDRAPTTVREPAAVAADHLADALVALEIPALATAGLVADLGAGAGVPGIPLAIAAPHAQLKLVEGNGRKCAFMTSVVTALELPNAEVVHARAETWDDGRGCMDIVTARALAPLDVVAEYAAPLLKVGGALIAWRGQREEAAELDAARAAEILGLEVQPPLHVVPYPGALNRHLHVLIKREPTPARFPRRDGVARKRPLGRARA